jgi:predicted MFS family arabinose efflux permease
LNSEIPVARKTEVWFGSYLFIGLVQNGMAPILLPLASHGGTDSGLSYAAFALTGLFAPIFGSWGDAEGRHRDLLIWGSTLAAVAFLPLCILPQGLVFILLAAFAGLGITAATTAGNVLAIAGLEEDLWNGRIGLLQRVVSTGQVLGLIMAGVMAAQHRNVAFILAFAALAVAAIVAIAYAPVSPARAAHAKPLPHPAVGGEAGAPGLQQNSHHSSFTQLAAFASVISRPLAQFLLIWFISYTAMNGVAVLFPLVMTKHYGMSPIMPALTYALGVCASLLIYGPVSRWTTKHGPGKTLCAGLGLRLFLFLALAVFSLIHAPYIGISVLITFALIQFVWPLLAVSTIAMSVSLARQAPGESIGLYNATSSIAASAGAATGGLIFGLYGFSYFSGAATMAVGVSFFLAYFWFYQSGTAVRKS